MNKLEKLIKELCPNGVENVELKGLCKIETGKLNANRMVENGKYPFFTCDENPYRINEFAFDTTAIIISGNGSRIGHINFYEGRFNAYQRTYVLSNFKNIIVKFLLHYLNGNLREYIKNNSRKGSVPYITMPMLNHFLVPFPPLPIQEEIVRILDTFTELEAELEAVLEARKKQYEYYRDELLTFEDDVEWQPMGKVLKRTKGTKITAQQMEKIHSDIGEIRIFAGGRTYADVEYGSIPQKDINTNPSIIVKSRGNIEFEYYDKPFSHKNEFWSYYSEDNNIKIKFVYYFLQTKIRFFQHKADVMQMPQISIPDTDKFLIPLPSLTEQQRIVLILDKFDSLVNDISIGLPAEIEARRKQYEYYRDKLLTFKKKEVV